MYFRKLVCSHTDIDSASISGDFDTEAEIDVGARLCGTRRSKPVESDRMLSDISYRKS